MCAFFRQFVSAKLAEALEDIIFGYKTNFEGDTDQIYIEAANKITEFNYRQLFGLSKEEMLAEPIEDYETNLLIHSLKIKNEEYQAKKAKR